jgi:exo-poly-alpha-galacturonosidase
MQCRSACIVLAAVLFCAGEARCQPVAQESPKQYVITDYGAAADPNAVNTEAIRKAIDTCAAAGGGVVVVPAGTFLSGAIFLKPGVDLRIEKDGVLKAVVDRSAFPEVDTRWEGEEQRWICAFINAFDMNDLDITGEGTIDGSGELWLKERHPRPRLIAIQNCRRVHVAGLSIKNQACWGLFILYSQNVDVANLTIRAAHNIPMSDGIDVDSSKDVHIIGCDIDTNDDCIAIKSGKDEDGRRVNRPAQDIVVEKCLFRYGHGGVSMGSEMSGGIRNVEIRRCTMEADNWAPIRFKSQPSRGGVVENITYRDIALKDTRKAFEFNMAWRMVNPKPPSDPLPVVRNVRIINVSGTTQNAGDMHGLPGSPIRNVSFENCHIKAQKQGLILDHVEDLDLSGLTIEVPQGEPIIRRDRP